MKLESKAHCRTVPVSPTTEPPKMRFGWWWQTLINTPRHIPTLDCLRKHTFIPLSRLQEHFPCMQRYTQLLCLFQLWDESSQLKRSYCNVQYCETSGRGAPVFNLYYDFCSFISAYSVQNSVNTLHCLLCDVATLFVAYSSTKWYIEWCKRLWVLSYNCQTITTFTARNFQITKYKFYMTIKLINICV